MSYSIYFLFSLLAISWGSHQRKETIRFKAADGMEMVADLYMAHNRSADLIILFHQAGSSRGEYLEIAPRLNQLGYNCLVPDLRAGGVMNDVENITKQNALKALKGTGYIDALQDMIGAIDYGRQNLTRKKIIIWGSSYSASLALKLSGDMKDDIDAVVAFSPGEYFIDKSRDYISSSAINVSQPVFITSARSEKNDWWGIYVSIPSDNKSYFIPQGQGQHGSKALWKKFPDSEDYWKALVQFLKSI